MPLDIPKFVNTPSMKPYMPGQEDNVGSNRVLLAIPKVIPPMAEKMLPIPDVIPPMMACFDTGELANIKDKT